MLYRPYTNVTQSTKSEGSVNARTDSNGEFIPVTLMTFAVLLFVTVLVGDSLRPRYSTHIYISFVINSSAYKSKKHTFS